MASDSWGEVLKVLSTGQTSVDSTTTSLGQQLAALTAQLQTMTQSVPATATAAKMTGTASGESTLGGIGNTILGFLGGGMGLSPLVNGLFSLFGGGGDSSSPAALPFYAVPPKVAFDGLYDAGSGSVSEASTGQGGQVRALTPKGEAAVAPQITVNVHAMDSQSFLDHSDDIARAVRLAMLQSNVLNDVVREL